MILLSRYCAARKGHRDDGVPEIPSGLRVRYSGSPLRHQNTAEHPRALGDNRDCHCRRGNTQFSPMEMGSAHPNHQHSSCGRTLQHGHRGNHRPGVARFSSASENSQRRSRRRGVSVRSRGSGGGGVASLHKIKKRPQHRATVFQRQVLAIPYRLSVRSQPPSPYFGQRTMSPIETVPLVES